MEFTKEEEALIAAAAAGICQEEADHGRDGAEVIIRSVRSRGLKAHT